jgi:hypothetical protein
MNDKWPQQKYSFNFLIDKFQPPGWPLPEVEPLKAKRQGTVIKGIRGMLVKDLWAHRVGISDIPKRWRLEIFWDAFDKFLNGDKERYANYLMTHRFKKPRNPTDKDKKHVQRKLQSAWLLLEDIKANGMKAPLEFHQQDGNLILLRGYRRLGIAHHLGMKRVAARVFKDGTVARKFYEPFYCDAGTISDLAAQQYTEHIGHATDKWYVHNYTQLYDRLFSRLRNRKIKLLEIGLLEGASLALWHKAFPRADIYWIDITEKWRRMAGDLDRITVFKGDQTDKVLLSSVAAAGPYDIVIDDCGHQPDQQWASFIGLWDALKPGGWYVIEDCYRSFKPGYRGRNVPKEFAGWLPSIYTNHEVKSLIFEYNICAVQKGIEQ